MFSRDLLLQEPGQQSSAQIHIPINFTWQITHPRRAWPYSPALAGRLGANMLQGGHSLETNLEVCSPSFLSPVWAGFICSVLVQPKPCVSNPVCPDEVSSSPVRGDCSWKRLELRCCQSSNAGELVWTHENAGRALASFRDINKIDRHCSTVLHEPWCCLECRF